MCGILGLRIAPDSKLRQLDLKHLIKTLYLLSETRGKEASGISIKSGNSMQVIRSNNPASTFIKSKEFNEVIAGAIDDKKQEVVLIGHTRLVTNGDASFILNNQPVVRDNISLVHNGIVCNDQQIWSKLKGYKATSQLDSEVIAAFLANEFAKGKSIDASVDNFYKALEGDASVACLLLEQKKLLLATNTGSIYYIKPDADSIIFASELSMLNGLIKKLGDTFFDSPEILRLQPKEKVIIGLESKGKITVEDLNFKPTLEGKWSDKRKNLKRCTKCILPETFPGISFDDQGVCDICRDYVPFHASGRKKLEELCNKYRKNDGTPDCIVGVSGGRDSSYALHYLKKEMKMNPIAYTYDWGMVTDLARRNISRLCGKLGVEHILVSADIPRKRQFIKMNVDAWLKKPELGMVSLFMAGDKEFFYHYKKIQEDMDINLVFFASNRLEQSGFKSGFCGVTEKNSWYLSVPIAQKMNMMLYFIKNFINNPAYINSSMKDTLFSFYCAYALKHNFKVFYDYIDWNESEIMQILTKDYNWEMATDTGTSWRIGDGTAAFYNYIYYKLAGFTEHDTFLSNQIRQGTINRKEALKIAEKNNQPRFESIKEYARTIGFDYEKLINIIEVEKPIYVK